MGDVKALFVAAALGRPEVLMEKLDAALQNGVCAPAVADSAGNTLLHWAAQRGLASLVSPLVKRGALTRGCTTRPLLVQAAQWRRVTAPGRAPFT